MDDADPGREEGAGGDPRSEGTRPSSAVSGQTASTGADDVAVSGPHLEAPEGGGDVAGTLAPDTPVEPGHLDPQNALFVILGGYLGILAVAAFVGAGGGLSARNLVLVTVGYATLAVVVYVLLARTNPDT